MSLPRLISLTRRRWAIPILGDLHRLDGAKFVTLCHRLESHQGAMRQSLDHLIALGLVERNPGYGHPLRPEYILTRAGASVAPACAAIDDVLADLGLREICLRRWALPVMRVVAADEELRFSTIAERLRTITDRALALSLRDLSGATLVEREVIHSAPPGSIYRLTRRGEKLARLATAL